MLLACASLIAFCLRSLLGIKAVIIVPRSARNAKLKIAQKGPYFAYSQPVCIVTMQPKTWAIESNMLAVVLSDDGCVSSTVNSKLALTYASKK